MSNALPATPDATADEPRTLADLAHDLDRAVRGDAWWARAAVDGDTVAVVAYDAHGNIEREWCLGATVAAELVDGDWLSGREIGYAIDLAEAACRREAA